MTHKGQHVGYVRVSSLDQNTARQLADVEVSEIFTDKCSGKDIKRSKLKVCLKYLRKGDNRGRNRDINRRYVISP